MSMDELIDRLAHYTQEHIRLMRENIREDEYLNCKKTLKEIAAEIALRRKRMENESPEARNTEAEDAIEPA